MPAGEGERRRGPERILSPALAGRRCGGRRVGRGQRAAAADRSRRRGGRKVALSGGGPTKSLATDSAGDFYLARTLVDEEQQATFEGLSAASSFTLGNLPASCSASSTAPIAYATGPTGGQSIQAALEDSCGAGSFSVSQLFSGTKQAPIVFTGALAGADQPLLSCAVASGPGSCSTAGVRDGEPGRVEKRSAGSGELLETLDGAGSPRTVALDGGRPCLRRRAAARRCSLPLPRLPLHGLRPGRRTGSAQFGAGQVIGDSPRPGQRAGGRRGRGEALRGAAPAPAKRRASCRPSRSPPPGRWSKPSAPGKAPCCPPPPPSRHAQPRGRTRPLPLPVLTPPL